MHVLLVWARDTVVVSDLCTRGAGVFCILGKVHNREGVPCAFRDTLPGGGGDLPGKENSKIMPFNFFAWWYSLHLSCGYTCSFLKTVLNRLRCVASRSPAFLSLVTTVL